LIGGADVGTVDGECWLLLSVKRVCKFVMSSAVDIDLLFIVITLCKIQARKQPPFLAEGKGIFVGGAPTRTAVE